MQRSNLGKREDGMIGLCAILLCSFTALKLQVSEALEEPEETAEPEASESDYCSIYSSLSLTWIAMKRCLYHTLDG